MQPPKMNSLVFCLGAVYTDPWWNLAGVFTRLGLQGDGEARFDAFVLLGDMKAGAKALIDLQIVDPRQYVVLQQRRGYTYAGDSGMASRVFSFDLTFPRTGLYPVEILADGYLLDSQTLEVVLAK